MPTSFSPSGQSLDIGSLGGTDTQPNAINNSGEIVGFSTTPNTTHAFLYAGKMKDLGVLIGAVTSDANGINDEGDVVGQSSFADGNSRAFLYTDGVMEDLNSLIGSRLPLDARVCDCD